MIDWLDPMCKAWGRCSRWILADTGEGYPSRDTIAKAHDGLLSLRENGPHSQHFSEVRVGDALLVANAMKVTPLMPFELQATMWTHYVTKAPAKKRAHLLGRYLGRVDRTGLRTLSVPEYWRFLDRAHWFLAARIEAPQSGQWTVPKLDTARFSA